MKESDSERIARIEEGMVNVHRIMERNHTEVMDALGPVQKHGEEIIILKRDRYWIFGIATFLGGLLGYQSHK